MEADENRGRRFEDLLAEVERVVRELESGDLALEDSLERYQQGIEALKRCYAILEETQKKIERVLGEQEGRLVVREMEVEEAVENEKPAGGAESRRPI